MKSLILVCFLFIGCGSAFQMNDRDKAIYQMIGDFSNQISTKGLQVIGLGGGLNHDTGQYQEIEVSYGILQIGNLQAGRILLTEAISGFIDYTNSQTDILQYIATNPVDIKNIHISIITQEEQATGLLFMHNCGNKLYYYIQGDDPEELTSKEVHEETYEEALAILGAEKASSGVFSGEQSPD